MKRIVIFSLFAIFMQVVSFAQSGTLKDSGYLGMLPIEEKMKSACEYYDLTEVPDTDGYKVYRHSNGPKFLFRANKIADKYQPKVSCIFVIRVMHKCRNLDVVVRTYSKPYGKYCLMTAESLNNFRRIANRIMELDNRGNVIPNGECPFFNRDIDQTECPDYR